MFVLNSSNYTMKQIITIIQQKSDWKRQVQFSRLIINVLDTKEEALQYAIDYPYGTHIDIFEDGESRRVEK